MCMLTHGYCCKHRQNHTIRSSVSTNQTIHTLFAIDVKRQETHRIWTSSFTHCAAFLSDIRPTSSLKPCQHFKYMYRIYTNSTPPQFRPHCCLIPSMACSEVRPKTRNQRLGVGALSFHSFVSLSRGLLAISFCSFYYLRTIG